MPDESHKEHITTVEDAEEDILQSDLQDTEELVELSLQESDRVSNRNEFSTNSVPDCESIIETPVAAFDNVCAYVVVF